MFFLGLVIGIVIGFGMAVLVMSILSAAINTLQKR